jgi:hypothetical protein
VLTTIGKPAGDRLAFLTTGAESDRRMSAAILANPFQIPGNLGGRPHIPFGQFRQQSRFLSSESQNYLIEALSKTTDVTTRKHLIEALQNIQEPLPPTSALVENVLAKDRDEDIRMAAATIVSQWLSEASVTVSEPFLDALTRALTSDPSWEVRKAAAVGLSTCKSPTSELIMEVRKAKQDPVNSVRQAALVTLSKFAVYNQDAMPDLIEALKEQDRATIQNALNAVGAAGVRAAPAVPALLALDTSQMTDMRVLLALKATQSDSPAVVRRMLASLESAAGSNGRFERYVAVQYFLRQTPATASVAVPALQKIAAEGQPDSNDAKRVLRQLNVIPSE